MTTANKTRLRSTLSAVIAILVMFGPDILEALSVTDASPKWVKLVAKGLGLVIGLATSGKAVALLNRFLPGDISPPDKSNPLPPVAAVLALFVGLGLLGWSAMARADEHPPVTDTVGNWQPAWGAGAATVFNFSTGAITEADPGSCFSLTHKAWHVGGDLCLHFRLATKDLANSFTPSIGGHYRNAGAALGVQKTAGSPLALVLLLTAQAAILGGY